MVDRVFRQADIVLFEERVIFRARPPVTDQEIARIEEKLSGPVPPDLKALWRLCYGGRVDYDLDVAYGAEKEHIHRFSFSEIFYPGSDSYRDLDGWIEHEQECMAEAEGEEVMYSDCRLDLLPFGGFEYLERLYVRVDQEDYGAIYAFSEGIPEAWPLSLHQASVTRLADDLREFFGLLHLRSDPLTADPESYAAGLEALEAIEDAVRHDTLHPAEAEELKQVLHQAVPYWRAAIDDGRIAGDAQLCRLALEHLAETGDEGLLSQLEAAGVDLFQMLPGRGNLLDHALAQKQIPLVHALLDRGLPAGDQTLQLLAPTADRVLVERLVRAGARANDHAIYQAASSAGGRELAERLAGLLLAGDRKARGRLIERCEDGARSSRASAERISDGEMHSNLSAEDYRAEAERLDSFAAWLRPRPGFLTLFSR